MVCLDVIESIPYPSMVVNVEGRLLSFNKLFKEEFSVTVQNEIKIDTLFDDWVEEPNSIIIAAKFGQKHYMFIRETVQGSKSSLYFCLTTDGLFKMKSQIKELEKTNRELSTIIENSYDGIYITDHEGVTLKTNTAIERITGIPKEYYIGKKVDALIKRGILKISVTDKVLKQRRTVSVVQENFSGNEILITGNPVFDEHGEIEKVVTNIRDLSDLNELQAELKKTNEANEKFKREIDRLKQRNNSVEGVVINNERMKIIYDMVDRIANVDATLLILGETGVGKDVFANYLYKRSSRSREGQFIKVNCGAIPPDLLESELFGYESGAFTGASRKGKPGMFELADNGILFLDEVGELPLTLQVKLLGVLQDKEFQRIGGITPKKVNVRVIAATNRNLKEMVSQGSFREDLYYRLNVIPVIIPPLKERREDILPLIQMFLNKFNESYQLNKEFEPKLNDFFYTYDWPGNIRELSNLIERLVIITENKLIRMKDLPHEYKGATKLEPLTLPKLVSLREAVEMTEEQVLLLALEKYNNTYEIAEALDTSQPTIVRKLKKYNLKT